MPELLNRSLDDMLAAMAAHFGMRWPNAWWPKGISAYDDCAACVSYFLFGLNSLGNPFYSYVSQIQTWGRQKGVWHAGHAGVERGDVLAFDWDGDGDPDHTEIVVSVSSGGSIVTSRGTNSNPGDDMRDRTRSAGYILSYIRPAYPGSSTSWEGANAVPINDIPTGDEFDMASLDDLNRIVSAAVNAAVGSISDRIALSEQRDRRESRPARVYKRADGTLWIAGPTVVPRQVLADSPQRNDKNILKGDTLLVDAGDFASPQPISDIAWAVLVEEHDRFRNAIADAVVSKLK